MIMEIVVLMLAVLMLCTNIKSIPTAFNKKKAAEKEKVVPEKEIVAYYTPRMRETRFNTNFKRDENENKKMFKKIYVNI